MSLESQDKKGKTSSKWSAQEKLMVKCVAPLYESKADMMHSRLVKSLVGKLMSTFARCLSCAQRDAQKCSDETKRCVIIKKA